MRKRKRKRILADDDAAELGAVLSSDSEAVLQAASPSSTNQNKPARTRVQKKANYAEALGAANTNPICSFEVAKSRIRYIAGISRNTLFIIISSC